MTQEWFESADFEKTANNEKKDNPSDPVIPQEELKEKEEFPVVEESLQVNPEDRETIEETVETEEKPESTSSEVKVENTPTEAPQPSKSLESPFVPDPLPARTAIFKEELADFWVWLQGALKEPTACFDTDKKHSYTAFALLTIFSATSFLFTIYHAKQGYYGRMASMDAHFVGQFPSLNLFSIFSILVATSLFYFSILMSGFVVKRFIDQDSDWTLERVLQVHSRLFAIPVLLTGIASFFALFNGLRFAALLCFISVILVLLANLYIISRPSKDSQTDPFYRLLLAVLINSGVLFLFFLAEMALVFDYLRVLAFL